MTLLFVLVTFLGSLAFGYDADTLPLRFANSEQSYALCCAAWSGESLDWRGAVPESEIVTYVTCADVSKDLQCGTPPKPLQHTLAHIDCPACAAERKSEMTGESFAARRFPNAAEIWLSSRRRIADSTREDYSNHIKHLCEFFELMCVADIRIENVRAYQNFRQEQIRTSPQHRWSKRIRTAADSDGASCINHEINCVLRPVLRTAGKWKELEAYYEPLPLPAGSCGVALTADEEQHLFEVAKLKPHWVVAYCAGLLSRNTTADPSEIQHLRVRSIDFERQRVLIEEGTKNDFRARGLPLNPDALNAARILVDRYFAMCQKYGITPDVDHYILYHRASKKGLPPDPTRPMDSWKRAHYALRAEAAKKFPRLAKFRRKDYRHTACTEMLENPSVSFTAIEVMMGHRLGSNTKRKYEHLRDDSLRKAADALYRGHSLLDVPPPPKPPEPMKPRLMVVWERKS